MSQLLVKVSEPVKTEVARGPLTIVTGPNPFNSPFCGFTHVGTIQGEDVFLVTRVINGRRYTHAEPVWAGSWAMGGAWLVDGNGNHPEFQRPVPLHDYDTSKEGQQ